MLEQMYRDMFFKKVNFMIVKNLIRDYGIIRVLLRFYIAEV